MNLCDVPESSIKWFSSVTTSWDWFIKLIIIASTCSSWTWEIFVLLYTQDLSCMIYSLFRCCMFPNNGGGGGGNPCFLQWKSFYCKNSPKKCWCLSKSEKLQRIYCAFDVCLAVFLQNLCTQRSHTGSAAGLSLWNCIWCTVYKTEVERSAVTRSCFPSVLLCNC